MHSDVCWVSKVRENETDWYSNFIQSSTKSCFMHETLWVVCEWEHSINVWYIYQTRHRDYWGNKRYICNRSNRWESQHSLTSLLYLDLRQSWLTFWEVLAPSQTRNLVLSLRTPLALCVAMLLSLKSVQAVLGTDPFISISITISQPSLTPKGLTDSPRQSHKGHIKQESSSSRECWPLISTVGLSLTWINKMLFRFSLKR